MSLGTIWLKPKVCNVLLCVAALTLTACNRYSAEPTEGWIIDAETKKPIKGVIVVANWQLHKSTLGGKTPADHLNISETTTNNQGHFYFDGWEQKIAPWGFFIDRDPELIFYKEGYEYLTLKNPKVEIDTSNVRQSFWDGKTIELKRFNGEPTEYAAHLSSLNASLHSIFNGDGCEWKRTPELVMAMAEQAERFGEREIARNLTSLDDISGYFCGSARGYLESIGAMAPAT